jgi:hypothetical protein
VNLTPSTVTWGTSIPTYWVSIYQLNGGSNTALAELTAIITDLGVFVAG